MPTISYNTRNKQNSNLCVNLLPTHGYKDYIGLIVDVGMSIGVRKVRRAILKEMNDTYYALNK